MNIEKVSTTVFISICGPNIENASVTSVRRDYLYCVNFDGKIDCPGWKVNSGANVDWLMVMKNKFWEIKFRN